MGHKTDLFLSMLVRLVIASPLFAIQIWMIWAWGDFGIIFGLLFGLGGALIVFPKVTDFLSEPFRALIYPLRRFDKPVPMYSVPMSKRVKGDYTGALEYYEKMEVEYPGDMEIYRGMLELLVLEMKDPAKASQVFQRALRSLKTTDKKDGLARIYHGMLSQAKGQPEWLMKQRERSLQTTPHDGVPVEEPDGIVRRRFHSGGHQSG